VKLKEKYYLKTSELIENIKEKGINIKNERKIEDIISHNNYYYITGYKELFKSIDGKYKNNVYFEDIYNIYIFDKELKLIFTKILFKIEQNIKIVFCNNFCNRYGYTDVDLLDIKNYDRTNKYTNKIMNKLQNQIKWYGSNNDAVIYYVQKYSNIPIWVLIKVLTFGMVRDLITIQKPNVKDHINKELVNNNMKIVEMLNMLELLITYRNICCHDDKLIGYIHNKVNIPNTKYHKHFGFIKDKNGLYTKGKKDMLAALIAIKYFVDRRTYTLFINRISKLIDEYVNKMKGRITRDELLKYINLPYNFTEIKRL